MALAAPHAPAQDGALNVSRISFVQGSVQLLAGQGNDFQQAVMNMPVVDGSRLQTGGDGQAEIEFGDGSVARLTPNSGLQFDHLAQDQVQLQQLGGLGYYEFNVGQGHPAFNVQFANLNVQPAANSIVRVGLDAGWDVAVINGAVNVQGEGIPGVNVSENQSIRSGADNSGAPYTVAQGVMVIPGTTGIRIGTKPLHKRHLSKRRSAMTRRIRRAKTGTIWMPTVTGTQSRVRATSGFLPVLDPAGIPMGPGIGRTIRPSGTHGFPAIPGAGSRITAVPGTTTLSVGDGLLVVIRAAPGLL